MWTTCDNVAHMTMIQIRHVPEDVHRTLKARAAKAGMSLSDFLLHEIERMARRPDLEELFARIDADGRVIPKEDSAAAVRAERDAR